MQELRQILLSVKSWRIKSFSREIYIIRATFTRIHGKITERQHAVAAAQRPDVSVMFQLAMETANFDRLNPRHRYSYRTTIDRTMQPREYIIRIIAVFISFSRFLHRPTTANIPRRKSNRVG